MDQIVKGKIANALTSAAIDHVVATTDDIYDEYLKKYQEDINKETKESSEGLKQQISTETQDRIVGDTTLQNTKQDKLVTGNNITINENVISTEYQYAIIKNIEDPLRKI